MTNETIYREVRALGDLLREVAEKIEAVRVAPPAPAPVILTRKEVAKRVGRTPSTISAKASNGNFPPPVGWGKWLSSDVDLYLECGRDMARFWDAKNSEPVPFSEKRPARNVKR